MRRVLVIALLVKLPTVGAILAAVALLVAGTGCAQTASASMSVAAPAAAIPAGEPEQAPALDPALTAWAQQVYEAIRANWNAPVGLLAEAPDLAAEVRVSIDADGTLRNARMFKSSENAVFDEACLTAVRTTKRVPPPPEQHRGRARKGMVIGFEGKSLPEAVEPP